jgi:hypothetical protein
LPRLAVLVLALAACGPQARPVHHEIVNVVTDDDHDGLDVTVDHCPAEPEDVDGFEDGDGCADPDNDRDGFADARDQCPNDPETINGFDDDDGCPDYR